jgi:hypothetical protein
MMTPEERAALQGVIVQELSERQQDTPTLLIDVLLSNHGAAFVYQTVHRRWQMVASMQTTMQHLLRALEGGAIEQPPPPPPVDDQAA